MIRGRLAVKFKIKILNEGRFLAKSPKNAMVPPGPTIFHFPSNIIYRGKWSGGKTVRERMGTGGPRTLVVYPIRPKTPPYPYPFTPTPIT